MPLITEENSQLILTSVLVLLLFLLRTITMWTLTTLISTSIKKTLTSTKWNSLKIQNVILDGNKIRTIITALGIILIITQHLRSMTCPAVETPTTTLRSITQSSRNRKTHSKMFLIMKTILVLMLSLLMTIKSRKEQRVTIKRGEVRRTQTVALINLINSE